MFRRIFIFTILAAASVLSVSAKSDDLKIVVEPADGSGYRISISFTGDADGTTKLVLPNEWGGQSELYKAVKDLSVSPESAKIADPADPHIRSITHAPGEKLTLTYKLAQDFQGPLTNSIRYRPVTDPAFIHWIGNAVWVLPDWGDAADIDVRIEWKNFPSGWTFANSFAAARRSQKFKTNVEALRSSLYVGGDFRLTRTSAAGKPINVAIRGKWQFTDAELADMVRRVIESQRAFWDDHTQQYFLVSLVPLDEGPNSFSFGGTGLTDSFALFATQNATVDRIRGLLSHEYSHNWIPAKMGRMPDPEQQLYWFSEGFDEFYTFRLLLRGGIISRDEIIFAYNERIREYYFLPVRTAPNERIVKDFWNDRDIGRLPYLRGFIFAANLNSAIVKASGGKRSLDDAMFDLVRASKDKPQALSFELLAETFKRQLGSDPAPLMKRQLIDGELIVPDADALGESVTLDFVQMPVFELGFDFDKFGKERVVAGVIPNSTAYDAGLRNGQQRNGGLSVTFGDTAREIELKVKDSSGEKTIRYLPVAKERVTIPQYKSAAR